MSTITISRAVVGLGNCSWKKLASKRVANAGPDLVVCNSYALPHQVKTRRVYAVHDTA